MSIGIYKLNFTGTDKVYIGQSRTLETRLNGHLDKLKSGNGSKKMQAAYFDFGSPTLEVLLECTVEELDTLERETIEKFNAVENGFNTLHYSGEYTPLPGELNGMSKYTNIQILEVFDFLIEGKLLYKDISKVTSVDGGIIRQISRGNNHTWIKHHNPEGYKIMISRLGSRNCASGKNIVYPKIKSPNGILYSITNAAVFAKEHKLDPGNLGKVLHRQRKSHLGWKLAESKE